MPNAYSMDDLLGFLEHAAKRGLMPTATAQALAAASRNVLGVLTDDEKADLGGMDIDAVFKRFSNKRAKDFNPASLKAYGQRVHRAIGLYLDWRQDPSNFTVKTRAPRGAGKRRRELAAGDATAHAAPNDAVVPKIEGVYQSSFPIRPGVVVTLRNVPQDLTVGEAERLANFIKLLPVE